MKSLKYLKSVGKKIQGWLEGNRWIKKQLEFYSKGKRAHLRGGPWFANVSEWSFPAEAQFSLGSSEIMIVIA